MKDIALHQKKIFFAFWMLHCKNKLRFIIYFFFFLLFIWARLAFAVKLCVLYSIILLMNNLLTFFFSCHLFSKLFFGLLATDEQKIITYTESPVSWRHTLQLKQNNNKFFDFAIIRASQNQVQQKKRKILVFSSLHQIFNDRKKNCEEKVAEKKRAWA